MKLHDAIKNMMARGVLQSTDDERGVQVVSVSLLAGEQKSNVERVQSYGFSSSPRGEAEAIVIFPGGDRSSGIVIALDNRGSRMTGLAAGEVAVYNDAGLSVVLKNSGDIEITTEGMETNAERTVTINTQQDVVINAQQDVTVTTPGRVLMFTPTLHVDGDILAAGVITPGAGSP
jgi:phage baseplate assembly protein V